MVCRLKSQAVLAPTACHLPNVQRKRSSEPDYTLPRRRQLESAALPLAGAAHALAAQWLTWEAITAAEQPPQRVRPTDQHTFVAALLAATHHAFSCPAGQLVEAAVPQLPETTLQLVSNLLVRGPAHSHFSFSF